MAVVSVVMPAYNSEDTISESIESVLSQSYKDFELLICDDGSLDSTRLIIEEFLVKDSRVKLLNNDFCKGAAGARNTCLEASKAKYIAFLDSDDLWDKDKLKNQIAFMDATFSPVSYSDYIMFDFKGNKKKIISPDSISFDDMTKKCNVGCLTVVINKELVGNFLFPNIPKEDYALWLVLLSRGFVFKRCSNVISFYRKQQNSISSTKFSEIFKQWYVLRNIAKLTRFRAMYCLSSYVANGIFKHYIKG